MLGQSKSNLRATARRLAKRMARKSPARKMRLLGFLVNWTIRLNSHLRNGLRGARSPVCDIDSGCAFIYRSAHVLSRKTLTGRVLSGITTPGPAACRDFVNVEREPGWPRES